LPDLDRGCLGNYLVDRMPNDESNNGLDYHRRDRYRDRFPCVDSKRRSRRPYRRYPEITLFSVRKSLGI